MRTRPNPLIPAILLLVTIAQSHKPGQEYTYLSMFSKPQTQDMIEGDNHLGQVYEQLSIHKKRHHRRQLSRFGRPTKLKMHQTHQSHPSRQSESSHVSDSASNHYSEPRRMSGLSLPHAINPSLKRIDTSEEEHKEAVKADEGTDDADEEDDADDDAPLQREIIPQTASKVRLIDVDESTSSDDQELADRMAHKYGENLERLQSMLRKIIRTYDIQSMADIPCRAHAHWMPLFLETLSEERENFKYYCVDTSKEVLKSVKESVTGPKNKKFVLRRFWQEALPKADLVFSWAGLDNMQSKNVAKYLERLSNTGENHKIIAVGTHGGELKKHGTSTLIKRFTAGGTPINVREAPFRLKKPLRVIRDLSTQGNDKKLYLYKPDAMK